MQNVQMYLWFYFRGIAGSKVLSNFYLNVYYQITDQKAIYLSTDPQHKTINSSLLQVTDILDFTFTPLIALKGLLMRLGYFVSNVLEHRVSEISFWLDVIFLKWEHFLKEIDCHFKRSVSGSCTLEIICL